MTDHNSRDDDDTITSVDNSVEKLPDHLLIEIFIRVPISYWTQISCVKKQWANLFRGECLWQAALIKTHPLAGQAKRWPGPIPRGSSRRRFTALYVSKHIFALDGEIGELVGHTYLFLKEQLELSTMPNPLGILHGTIIGRTSYKNLNKLDFFSRALEASTCLCLVDMSTIFVPYQFIACGKSSDIAQELASQIWVAVLDRLEENKHTFCLLKSLAQEGDDFLPYPYSRSTKVQWRVYEKLFTDFRDCFSRADYCDALARAKNKFLPIPLAWLGY